MYSGNVTSRIVRGHSFRFPVSVSISLETAMDWRCFGIIGASIVFSVVGVLE